MKKASKQIAKIIRKILFSIIILILLLGGIVHSAWFQSVLGKYASEFCSQWTGNEVSIGSLEFSLFKRVITIKDLKIDDYKLQALLHAEIVSVGLSNYDFRSIDIKNIYVYKPDIRICKYNGDSISDFKKIIRLFKNPDKDSTAEKVVVIRKIDLQNGRFRYDNENEAHKEEGLIDFKHIDILDFTASVNQLTIYKKNVYGRVKSLNLKESNGFQVDKMESWVGVLQDSIVIKKLDLETPYTNLKTNIVFKYENYAAFKDFVDDVGLEAEIKSGSKVNFGDIAYFTPALKGENTAVHLSGSVQGPLRDLAVNNLNVAYGKKTIIKADVRWHNFPKIKEGFFKLDADNIHVDLADIKQINNIKTGKWKLPVFTEQIEYASLEGVFEGKLEKFNTKLNILSNVGEAQIDIEAVDTLGGQKFFTGYLLANQLQLGKLGGIGKWIGAMNADLHLSAIGYDFEGMHYTLNGQLTEVEIMNNRIDRLDLDCETHTRYFHGYMRCDDDDLTFTLDGLLDYEQIYPITRCVLDLGYADLQAIGIMKDSLPFEISARVYSDYIGQNIDSSLGQIRLENLHMERMGAEFNLPYLLFSIEGIEADNKRARVSSEFLELNMTGNYQLANFKYILGNILSDYVPSFKDSSGISIVSKTLLKDKQEFVLHMGLHSFTDPRSGKPSGINNLLDLFVPQLQIDEKTQLDFVYKAPSKYYDLQLKTDYVMFNKMAVENAILKTFTSNNELKLSLHTDRFYMSDSMFMSQFSVKTGFSNSDTVYWNINWENQRDSSVGIHAMGDVKGHLDFSMPEALGIGLDTSLFYFASHPWQSFHGASVVLKNKEVLVNNVGIYSLLNGESVLINGEWSTDSKAEIEMHFSSFDISYFDFLTRKARMDIDANIDGTVKVRDPYNTFEVNSDIYLRRLEINGFEYGEASLEADFNKRRENINITLKIEKDEFGNSPDLLLKGSYTPRKKSLDFNTHLNNLHPAILQGYLESFSSQMVGRLSGDVHIGGTFKDLQLNGDIYADSLAMTINILQTRYLFKRLKIGIKPSVFNIEDGIFSDVLYGTNGSITGNITHNNFKNMAIYTKADFKNLLVLNTKPNKDVLYSGRVFASGQLQISGPFSDLDIKLQGKTERDSYVNFNFASTSGLSRSNFISFEKVEQDTLPEKFVYSKKVKSQEKQNKLNIELGLEITPDIKLGVDLHNVAMDGILEANGRGNMRLISRESGTQLFGAFTVAKGSFDLSMIEVINKRFSLREGGTISWTGPMSDARIDIDAAYSTRASLYPVLAMTANTDETALKKKVPIQSIIQMEGKLSNPDIAFDMELPSVSEDIKDLFFSHVNKDNEDEMIKQTFSLLMFNSLMSTGNNTDPADGNNALVSSSEILFNQLNGFISRMTKGFDVGVNYRPASGTDNSEFQVMMSGQLFDDRLVIDGNIAVSESDKATAKSASTVVGDVNVEWKFTEQLRLKAFNRSNEKDLAKPENTYTQGVGVVFRRDFNTLKELFSRMGPSKEERQEIRKQKKQNRLNRKKEADMGNSQMAQ